MRHIAMTAKGGEQIRANAGAAAGVPAAHELARWSRQAAGRGGAR